MKTDSVNSDNFFPQMTIEIFKLDENNDYQLFLALSKMRFCVFVNTIYKKYFSDILIYGPPDKRPFDCPLSKAPYRFKVKGYPFDMAKFDHFMSDVKPGSYRLQIFFY